MKISLPEWGNEHDNIIPGFGRKMREMMRTLEQAFAKIRLNGALIIGGGATISKHLSTTVTWDPPNLASGSQQTMTPDITLDGVATGDEVTVSFSQPLQGTFMWGEVIADKTIRVYHINGTGGAVDLASGTVRTSVWQH